MLIKMDFVLLWKYWTLNFTLHRDQGRELRVLTLFKYLNVDLFIENEEWRRLHNEELHSLYRPPNIVRVIKSRRLRWAGHVARMEEGGSAFKILAGKPTGRRPLERPRRRWEDNIRVNLKEIGINSRNWVDAAQNKNYWRALVNAALNLRVS